MLLAGAMSLTGIVFGGDWLTFSGNPQRTGWAKDETKLIRKNVKGLKLEWKAKLDNEFKELNSLTVPVVVINRPTTKGFKDIVIVAGASDTVFGLDADDGKVFWHKKMPQSCFSSHLPAPVQLDAKVDNPPLNR